MQEGVDLFKEGTANLSTKTGGFARKSTASVKAEANRVAKIGKLRYKHFRMNREAHKKFADIGGRIYDLTTKNKVDLSLDEPTQVLISDIHQIEEEIKQVEAEIQGLSRSSKKV